MDEKTIYIKLRLCKCCKCGHEWASRVELPKSCPKCKNRKWENIK